MARFFPVGSLLMALLVSTLFMACGSAGDTTGGSSTTKDAAPEATPDTEPEMVEEEVYSPMLPSPLQIAAIFKKSGLDYAEGLTNDPGNLDRYNSSMAKSLNFGVYSADLSYCVLNDQSNEARKYIGNVKQLAEELGMSAIFSTASLFDSFERNLGNQDSTLYILASIQEELDDYLSENQQEYMTSVFFAGAFVEGLYLGSQVNSGKDDNSRLAKRLVEQLTILENVVEALEHYPHPNDELAEVVKQLKNLNQQFYQIGAIKSMREKGEEFDFEQATFTSEELDGLTSSIQSIRNHIVNG